MSFYQFLLLFFSYLIKLTYMRKYFVISIKAKPRYLKLLFNPQETPSDSLKYTNYREHPVQPLHFILLEIFINIIKILN